MTENFDNFGQKSMGSLAGSDKWKAIYATAINFCSGLPVLKGAKKEAQLAKEAAGYDLLREKLMANKIACIPNYLKRLGGFQFK